MPPEDLGAISPLVYGSNYGPWVSLRPETLPLAEQSGVSILRYPGGAWGDNNDLEPYHIDQLVDLARRMGAEPYIHVRFPNGTPEQAAGTRPLCQRREGLRHTLLVDRQRAKPV